MGVTSQIVNLPLLGRVAAGTPILAEQNIEAMIPLPESIVGDAASFVLRVQGESMIQAGIFSGDFVVVKEQSDAVNGQIVVALIDDEATVKTFYREQDRVRLQPENPTMAPIYAKAPRILGRVIALHQVFLAQSALVVAYGERFEPVLEAGGTRTVMAVPSGRNSSLTTCPFSWQSLASIPWL